MTFRFDSRAAKMIYTNNRALRLFVYAMRANDTSMLNVTHYLFS